MGATPSRKDITHERIVRTASHAIRRSGYDGTGVADIMKAAGLTHGGFYAHFPSRTALLAEAADHAGAEALSRLSEVVEQAPTGQGLATLITHYLSDRHCQAVDQGCPMAALGSEMHRQEPAVRQAATRRIKDMVALAERQVRKSMGPQATNAAVRDASLALVSGLVGALVLARAVDDPAMSRAVLKASRAFLHDHVG